MAASPPPTHTISLYLGGADNEELVFDAIILVRAESRPYLLEALRIK